MVEKLISSGFGGQGVLSAGLILAKSAIKSGKEATFFPSYGAEMRGGTASCQVIVSDEKIGSPVVSTADSLLAFNDPSVTRFINKVKSDGLLMLNSSVIKQKVNPSAKKLVEVPIIQLAIDKIGSLKVANIILVGAFLRIKQFLKLDEVKKTILEMFEGKGKEVVDMNYQALEIGYAF
ncbi:MAG: 2-oxoacid:acceptor oxidoreductase family protein [Spirochaetales bacterium]|nr:2-oxoacid:acceptor oxidoreductase family protein [Spirochaetales bacterium]